MLFKSSWLEIMRYFYRNFLYSAYKQTTVRAGPCNAELVYSGAARSDDNKTEK